MTFQTDFEVVEGEDKRHMIPRTIEEALAFDNFELLRSGQLSLGITIPESLEDAYADIFKRIKSSSFKKTEFALDILAATEDWDTPSYIVEGLQWLENRLDSD